MSADDRPGRAGGGKRVVLATFGSLGDLHPYLAIGLGLKARGHEAVVATGACYREKVEALGLGFRPVRPDCDFVNDPVRMRWLMDPRWGLLRFGCGLLLPSLRESYADTLDAVAGADLLVSHPLTYASRLVAETTGVPWASTMVTPLGFFSACDLPLFPMSPGLSRAVRGLNLGPGILGPALRLTKRATRPLARPWYAFRSEIGLPPTDEPNPLSDVHSPRLVLALFSPHFAAPQADWPPRTVATGFPLYDRDGDHPFPPDLARFLDDGPPPVVFTLGSSVPPVAGTFFDVSAEAARRLGRRAVLVLGRNLANRPRSLPPDVMAVDYAPFSQLFPRAAAIVHPGGIGSTGLALRAGRPTLVVPFSHDHFDNATRLGTSLTMPARRYTPPRAEAALRRILDDPSFARRAGGVGEKVRTEDGVTASCDAIEQFLGSLSKVS